jgi:hypothetical protein
MPDEMSIFHETAKMAAKYKHNLPSFLNRAMRSSSSGGQIMALRFAGATFRVGRRARAKM